MSPRLKKPPIFAYTKLFAPAAIGCMLAVTNTALGHPLAATAYDNAPMQSAPNSSAGSQQPQNRNEKIYELGEAGITPPKPLATPAPAIDKPFAAERFQGVTIVELVLNTEGVPEHVHVVRSVAKDMKKKDRDKAKDLDQKAVEAVQQYRFVPAMHKGTPVRVQLTIKVQFHLFK